MQILAISGSLRAQSSNTSALIAAAMLAPAGMEVVLYPGLAELPHFNPDLDLDLDSPPDIVRSLRRLIGQSDGLLICSPEYAHGLAGSLKNALDWLVSSMEFAGTHVAVINTSPNSRHADSHLREVLSTMSARLFGETSTPLPLHARGLDAEGIVADPELSARLREALVLFGRVIDAAADE